MHSLNTIVNNERLHAQGRDIIERNTANGVYTEQERRFQASVDEAAALREAAKNQATQPA